MQDLYQDLSKLCSTIEAGAKSISKGSTTLTGASRPHVKWYQLQLLSGGDKGTIVAKVDALNKNNYCGSIQAKGSDSWTLDTLDKIKSIFNMHRVSYFLKVEK